MKDSAGAWDSSFWIGVEAAIKAIIDNPRLYRQRYARFHGCLVRRFPFSIFYTIEDPAGGQTEIVVHSVFDNRQNPQKRP
jgi:plasmid stabilization system protein ParE